jgi:hypothetical protein
MGAAGSWIRSLTKPLELIQLQIILNTEIKWMVGTIPKSNELAFILCTVTHVVRDLFNHQVPSNLGAIIGDRTCAAFNNHKL